MYYSYFRAITKSVCICVTVWHILSLQCNYQKLLFQEAILCPAIVLDLYLEFLKSFPQSKLQSIRLPISSNKMYLAFCLS